MRKIDGGGKNGGGGEREIIMTIIASQSSKITPNVTPPVPKYVKLLIFYLDPLPLSWVLRTVLLMLELPHTVDLLPVLVNCEDSTRLPSTSPTPAMDRDNSGVLLTDNTA